MGNSRFKFRAWNKELKSFLIHNEEDKTFDLNVFNSVLKNPKYLIMQCTGLKDKNGKLIYEGDIVKYAEYDWSDFAFKDWEQEIGKVVWGGNYDYPAFDLEKHNFECNSFAHIFNEGWTIEVIGNTYENPELLEEQND